MPSVFQFIDKTAQAAIKNLGKLAGKNKAAAADIDATGAAAAQSLIADGSGNAAWKPVPAAGLDSTGAASGQALVADGSGKAKFATLPNGAPTIDAQGMTATWTDESGNTVVAALANAQ